MFMVNKYVYILVIFIFVLFICTIKTHEPLTDLTQILIGQLGRTTGVYLAWFKNSKLSGSTSKGETLGKAGFLS